MGDFRIVIDAVGGHGLDRDKGDGEVVDFRIDGEYSPEYIAVRFVNELKRFGVNVESAKITHWPKDKYPARKKDIQDDLLTGIRHGSFKDDLSKE